MSRACWIKKNCDAHSCGCSCWLASLLARFRSWLHWTERWRRRHHVVTGLAPPNVSFSLIFRNLFHSASSNTCVSVFDRDEFSIMCDQFLLFEISLNIKMYRKGWTPTCESYYIVLFNFELSRDHLKYYSNSTFTFPGLRPCVVLYHLCRMSEYSFRILVYFYIVT